MINNVFSLLTLHKINFNVDFREYPAIEIRKVPSYIQALLIDKSYGYTEYTDRTIVFFPTFVVIIWRDEK